jgi:hypothetical protein
MIRAATMDFSGPTPQRLARAGNHTSIGDDKQGTRVYHMMDSPLDRLYSRLVRPPKTENQIGRLRAEYAALTKYHRLFVESGMVGSIGSVDPNRTYSPTPFNRTFLAGSEKQCNDRDAYVAAKASLNSALYHLGHVAGIVVDNVVCHGNSLELSGYCVGKKSQRRAIEVAEFILRDAGYRLAELWKMV